MFRRVALILTTFLSVGVLMILVMQGSYGSCVSTLSDTTVDPSIIDVMVTNPPEDPQNPTEELKPEGIEGLFAEDMPALPVNPSEETIEIIDINEIIEIIDEPIPGAELILPKTAGLPATILYIVGLANVSIGLILKIKVEKDFK